MEHYPTKGKKCVCDKKRISINESVDLIEFSFEIEAYQKIYHRHIVDIPRIKFLV